METAPVMGAVFFVLTPKHHNCHFYRMDAVQQWFDNGKNYQEGILIYSQLKGAKPNLVRLFFRKENTANKNKLAYELEKHKPTTTQPNIVIPVKETVAVVPDVIPQKSKVFFYKIRELHTSLHDTAIHQTSIYKKAMSLKMQLNELHKDEEGKALKFCLEIENIFDEIDAIQKVLKHYVDHKVVLDISKPCFTDLSPAQLLQRRNNKRANKTKVEKRITDLSELLTTSLSIAVKTKTEIALEKKQAKLLQLETDIVELMKLINTKPTS